MSYTCFSCRVVFAGPTEQRDHYRTDWHRYNLKRKVVGMLPVTNEWFQERLKTLQEAATGEDKTDTSTTQCRVCNKVYASENALVNHLQSNVHKENVAKQEVSVAGSSSNMSPKGGQAKREVPEEESSNANDNNSEDNEVEIVDEFFLEETDCLFCPHSSDSFEQNLEHMTAKHSFYIPNHQYLVDLKGFIGYLGQKVAQGFMCLYCNDTGPAFRSMEAAQKHMVDKGHCMVAYEDKDIYEYEDFYDFTSSYPDYDPNDPAQKDMAADPAVLEVNVDGSLVLPDGRHISHRDLARYHKQYLRPEDTRDSVRMNKSSVQQATMGRAIGNGQACGPIARREMYDELRQAQCQARWYMKTGVRANGLMKHFRLPNGFCQ